MIKGINQHVVPYLDGWGVYEEGNAAVLMYFATQEEAMSYANTLAQGSEANVLLHNAPLPEVGTVALMPHGMAAGDPDFTAELKTLKVQVDENELILAE